MEDEAVEHFEFIVSGIIVTALVIFGIVGNAISLSILSMKKMRSCINCSLQCLAWFDSLLLVSSLLVFGLPSLSIKLNFFQYYREKLYPLLIPWLFPSALIAHCSSTWSIVSVTIERYFAVCHPFRARTLCTYHRIRLCNVCVFVFSICFNLPRFWELRYDEIFDDKLNRTVLRVAATGLRDDKVYFEVYYTWLNLLVVYVIPFLILAVLNGLIFRTVRNANRKRLRERLKEEINLASMLGCVVVVFFVCHVFTFVITVVEYRGTLLYKLKDVSNALIVLNSSVKFVIYCVLCKEFRRVLFETIRKRNRSYSSRETQRSHLDDLPELKTLNDEIR